jgi:hypothetical protein
MEKTPLFSIPLPSTAIVQGPDYHYQGGNLTLTFTADDEGRRRTSELHFLNVRASRHRAEGCCRRWHVADVYDTLAEVSASDWVAELREATRPEWRDRWVMRHFMIYLDSFGCLEVVAQSADLGQPD